MTAVLESRHLKQLYIDPKIWKKMYIAENALYNVLQQVWKNTILFETFGYRKILNILRNIFIYLFIKNIYSAMKHSIF